jgi:hypothetical protein
MSDTKTVAGIEYNLDNDNSKTVSQSVKNLIEIAERLKEHGITSVADVNTGMAVFYCERTDRTRQTPNGLGWWYPEDLFIKNG